MPAISEDLGLQSFAKTSGSKGLQLFVPLNRAISYEKTKGFAHAVAERLEQEHPGEVVSRMQKALGKEKVLIDRSQNDEHKTTVNVYFLRAKEATDGLDPPLGWQDVEVTLQTGTKSANLL